MHTRRGKSILYRGVLRTISLQWFHLWWSGFITYCFFFLLGTADKNNLKNGRLALNNLKFEKPYQLEVTRGTYLFSPQLIRESVLSPLLIFFSSSSTLVQGLELVPVRVQRRIWCGGRWGNLEEGERFGRRQRMRRDTGVAVSPPTLMVSWGWWVVGGCYRRLNRHGVTIILVAPSSSSTQT